MQYPKEKNARDRAKKNRYSDEFAFSEEGCERLLGSGFEDEIAENEVMRMFDEDAEGLDYGEHR